MFTFKSNIIHRRKTNWKLIATALVSLVVSGFYAWYMALNGSIAWIDRLLVNLNLYAQSFPVYVGISAVLLVLSVWAFYYLFRPKKVKRGFVEFVDNKLMIRRGSEVYEIPQSDLRTLSFELRSLPPADKKPLKSLTGGSYMKIPTKDGEFITELDIRANQDRKELLHVIDYIRIEHDVPIHVKDASRGY